MKVLFALYLLLIHIIIGGALLKSDFIFRVQAKLGYEVIKDELTPHYYKMLAFHKRIDANIPDNAVLFIGDSLTQGLAVSAVYPLAINFGIGQDTTYGVLARIPSYSAISRSKLVVIAIGVNDLKRRGDANIIENFHKIVRLIPKGIPILFSAILPINENSSKRIGYNVRIKKINEKLKKICLQSYRLHCIDILPFVANSQGDLSNKFHIGDGVHLNSTGNHIWLSHLKGAVKSILNPRERVAF